MKVSDLEGAQLDYWVAKAEGFGGAVSVRQYGVGVSACLFSSSLTRGGDVVHRSGDFWEPSIDWRHAGPIIEREQINIQFGGWDEGAWRGYHYAWEPGDAFGRTPLIAAMRAYVASKFGEEVPDENISRKGL